MPTMTRRFLGRSRMDDATERIPREPVDDTDEAEPAPAPEQNNRHEQAEDPVFNRVEELFSAYDRTDPDATRYKSRSEYIRLFDPSAIDTAKTLQSNFTLEDLDAMDAENDPDLTPLLEARKALDEASGNVSWKMDGPSRRAAKKARRDAQEAFDFQKNAYLADNGHDAANLTPLAKLTIARAELAEQTFTSRHGRLHSNKDTNENSFREAQERYAEARNAYLEDMYHEFGASMTDEEKAQLRTSLNDHENGALAGEEANHYLTEINDDNKKSWFQKGTERYNRLSRPKKIAAMLAAGAIAGAAGAVIGLTGAAAGVGVGLTYGTRFARGYFSTEAGRRGALNETRVQQENSVTYAGNYDESRAFHDELAERGDLNDDTARTQAIEEQTTLYLNHRAASVEKVRSKETHDKRAAIGKAVGTTAVGAAGGILIEHFASYVSDFYHSHTGSGTGTPEAPKPTDTGTGTGGETPPAPKPEVPAPKPDIPPTSDHSRYLYGDYAGHNATVSVKSGGNIWNTVQNDIAARHPNLSTAEVNRLTGNVVKAMQAQHGSSLNVIPAGTYSVDLRNAA